MQECLHQAQQATLTLLRDAQEEILDAIHWLRTVQALIAGVVWGLIPLLGLSAFLTYAVKPRVPHSLPSAVADALAYCRFLALNGGGIFFWYRKQRLDEEEFGGHQALLTEGFAPSTALFTVRVAPVLHEVCLMLN